MVMAIIRGLITVVVVAAAAAAGWYLWNYYTLSPWTRDARVRANVVELAPDVSGLITEIDVVDNQKVAKGDVLYAIDRQRFSIAVDQAEASVAEKRAELKLAQDDADRDIRVIASDSGALSAETVETSRARAGESAASLQLAEAELASAKLDLERSLVRAPVNGYVTNLTATVGNYASRGAGVLALVDADSFYVYAYFMETKLPGVRIGDDAEVELLDGGVLHGKVQGVSRAIASSSAGSGLLAAVDPNFEWIRLAQRIPVRIALDKSDIELVAGMSATVVIRPAAAAR